MKISVRDVVTPAAAGLFLFMAVSGTALFFHLAPGFFHRAHEWLGLPFAAVALWHVQRNWRGILSYVTRSAPRAIFSGLVAASLALAVFTMSGEKGGPRPVLQALNNASLADAATALGTTPDAAVKILHGKGIDVTSAMPVGVIAKAAHLPPVQVLSMLVVDRHEDEDD